MNRDNEIESDRKKKRTTPQIIITAQSAEEFSMKFNILWTAKKSNDIKWLTSASIAC